MPLLAVDGLDATYGRIRALSGVSLHVERGEIVALIGANGAGKTTTLRAISGLLRPSRGTIAFDGVDITALGPSGIVRSGISHAPEGRRVFARMSVAENLALGAYTRRSRGDVARDLARVYATFPRLYERRAQCGGTLSGGEQQMLALGRAMMARPRLLMLDEPSLGLSPILVQAIFSVIGALNADGTSVLLVEQNVRRALSIASRGYVLEVGKIVHEDTAANLLRSDAVSAAYLGTP